MSVTKFAILEKMRRPAACAFLTLLAKVWLGGVILPPLEFFLIFWRCASLYLVKFENDIDTSFANILVKIRFRNIN